MRGTGIKLASTGTAQLSGTLVNPAGNTVRLLPFAVNRTLFADNSLTWGKRQRCLYLHRRGVSPSRSLHERRLTATIRFAEEARQGVQCEGQRDGDAGSRACSDRHGLSSGAPDALDAGLASWAEGEQLYQPDEVVNEAGWLW